MILARLLAAQPEARRLFDILEHRFGEEAVSVSLVELADGRWSAEALFPEGDAEDIAASVRDGVGGDGFSADLTVDALPERDWVAESLAGLAPVRAGPFVVHGGHDRDRLPPSRFRIEIEAAQAFGTGHHATTAGCLSALARLAGQGRFGNALDLGTGSGVLAIALARLGVPKVLATDIDPLAVRETALNARLNRVAGQVTAARADGVRAPVILARAPFDLVVANILAGPLIDLAPALAPLIKPGAPLVLSGLLSQQRAAVVAAYRALGLRLRSVAGRDGWSTLILERPITTGRR